jgi:hypothetical protein
MTFVFIITGDRRAQAARYQLAARAAMMSVRHFHPQTPIVCLCDPPTTAAIADTPEVWSGLLDHVIPCPDATGGPTHRSRFIKTSLRQRLTGPCVFLDCDTFLLQDIGDLLACDGDLGVTADAYFTTNPGGFPAWARPLYDEHGWTPGLRYFNTGVMFIADTPRCHQLFDTWHQRYEEALTSGMLVDQPAFNAAIQDVKPKVVEFPETFNFTCGREPRQVPDAARLIHVFQSNRTTTLPAYTSVLADLDRGVPLTVEAMIHRLRMQPRQHHPRWYMFREVAIRIRDTWRRSSPPSLRSDLRQR